MLERKKALTNQIYDSPAFRSREMVGRAVEVTVDSTAVSSEVTAQPAIISQKRQPLEEEDEGCASMAAGG